MGRRSTVRNIKVAGPPRCNCSCEHVVVRLASCQFENDVKSAPVSLIGLFTLAIVAVLHVAADLLVPIALAILLNLLLSPIVQRLGRRGIPPALSAALLMSTIVGFLVFAVSGLAEPAGRWISEAPKAIREIQSQVFAAQDQLSGIQELAEEVEELTSSDAPPTVQEVVVKEPGVFSNVVGHVPAIAAFSGIVIFLTFFLLASGDTMLRRMTQCGRTWTERRRIVSIARQVQIDLSHYLATVTIVNITLAGAVATTMYWLQVPNPLLWGAMAGLFNFAPYVGALASTAVMTVVGVMTFDTLSDALMVPLTLLVLTIVEGQLITPAVLGRRLSVHPLVVFLAIVFWGWLWGVAGALMAVPIVTCLKVIADHVPQLAFVASFIRREPMAAPSSANLGSTCKSYHRGSAKPAKRPDVSH